MAPARSTPSSLNRRSFLSLASAFSLALRWPGIALAEELTPAATAVPRDLPIAGAPPSAEEWLDHAITLQPWGATEYKALTELPLLPRQLKNEFGFNAIIVLPWQAHNALTDAALPLTDPATRLTEEQFRAGMERTGEQATN